MLVSWHPIQLASCKRLPRRCRPVMRQRERSAPAGSIAIRPECFSWLPPTFGHAERNVRCFYYFLIVVVIRYKTKATACRALTFIVRIFVNDAIAIALWTSFDTITIALWISFHLYV